MSLADVQIRRGDLDRAQELEEDALALFGESGPKGDLTLALASFAEIAIARGQARRGARLLGAADVLRPSQGMLVLDEGEWERLLAKCRAALAEDAFTAAFEEGRAMSLDEAVAYAKRREE